MQVIAVTKRRTEKTKTPILLPLTNLKRHRMIINEENKAFGGDIYVLIGDSVAVRLQQR